MTTTPQSPSSKRGDVILVLFPNSNLTTAKNRPALVVQADHLDTGIPQVIKPGYFRETANEQVMEKWSTTVMYSGSPSCG